MFEKVISTALAILLAVIIAPGPALAAKTKEDTFGPAKCTVVMVIDGLQQSHLQLNQTPNIKGLINSGVTADEITGAPNTVTGAVSLLLSGNENAPQETISKFYSSQSKDDIKTVFIDGTGGQLEVWAKGADICPKGFPCRPENIIQTALKEINAGENTFCVIVLPQVNPQDLSATDNQIGFLLNHLRKLNILSNSIISVTGTTGDPPVILCGTRVKTGINVPIASFQDVAATIRFLNNQEPSGTGMVLYEAIETDGIHSQEYLLQQRIKDLSESYARISNEMEQMRQEQQEVRNQQLRLNKEKAKYTSVIENQQKEIKQLKLKITLFKLGGWLAILLVIISLYIEYRFLKKRFMFFT